MTTADHLARAVSDPIGLITDLVADVEKGLGAETIRAEVAAVAGGRAKSRRLAEALAIRPAILTDGRSPAPRAIGDLLIGLRRAGASAISPPVCAECGKKLRTFQRQGQDWCCSVCGQETMECTVCGNVRRVGFRDRKGLPRCKMCPDNDDRNPVAVVHSVNGTPAGPGPSIAMCWYPGRPRSAPARSARTSSDTSSRCTASAWTASAPTASWVKPSPPEQTPMHLAAIFEISETTAVRYTTLARRLLAPAE